MNQTNKSTLNSALNSTSMYKEHILELWKHPINFGNIKKKTLEKRGFNETCGDDVTVQLLVKDRKVKDIGFTGKGCALCMASASLVTEKIKEMNIEDALKLSSKDVEGLLEVEINPARLKCVLLPLETIQKAIREEQKIKKEKKQVTKNKLN